MVKRRSALLALVALCSCVRGGFGPASPADGHSEDAPLLVDAARDAQRADSGPLHPGGSWRFGAVEPLREINSTSGDMEAFLAGDGLVLYFSSARAGGAGAMDIYAATRPSQSAPFQNVTNLVALNTPEYDSLAVTADGLTGFLTTGRPGGPGGIDIWIGVRPSTSTDWASTQFRPDSVLSGASEDWDAVPSLDGRRVYFAPIDGTQRLVVGECASAGAAFATPTPIPGISESGTDADPTLSADERVLVFSSARPGGPGQADLWYAVRSDRTESFSAPQLVPSINTAASEEEPFLSPDGTELYFTSNRAGGTGSTDIYRVRILEGP